MKQTLVNLALNAPLIGEHLKRYRTYKNIAFEPGHYYSVIPDLEAVEQHANRIYGNDTILGIDLRIEEQKAFLEQLKNIYQTIPYRFSNPVENDAKDLRYKIQGAFYRNSDAIFLHCILRHFKPRKVVEIGSGHSSAIMLDTNDLFLNNQTQLTFVEPFPEERLEAVLAKGNAPNAKVVKAFIQDVDEKIYTSLEENDILFVDSSHVSKVDSDVNHIMFNMLPKLKPGVLIHFHDIFYPFELPKPWVVGRKWFWNENYLLRAFLINNPDYRIVLFNDLMHKKHTAWFEKEMPECLIDRENTGSIWIQKIK